MLVTGPIIVALQSLFSASYDGIVAGLGHPELQVNDWSPTSLQYFEANLHPDDLEESDEFKYPCCFLHGVRSTNTHEQYGTDFSGTVIISLRFYITTKAERASTAARAFEIAGNAVESAVNQLLADNQWPQDFGVPGGVCGSWPMTREPASMAGENWRQGYLFTLSVEVTTS